MSSAPSSAQSLQLSDYLKILARRKVVVALALLVGLVAGWALASFRPSSSSQYIATAKVLIPGDQQQARTAPLLAGAWDVDTSIEIIRSDLLATAVKQRIQTLRSEQELLGRLSVNALPETRVIAVTYRGASGKEAEDTANAFAEVFVERRRGSIGSAQEQAVGRVNEQVNRLDAELRKTIGAMLAAPVGQPDHENAKAQQSILVSQLSQLRAELSQLQLVAPDHASVIEGARAAQTKTASGSARNVAAGGALGLLLGVVLAFAANSLDSSVDDQDDLERLLGAPILGSIPRLPHRPPHSDMRVSTIVNPAGPETAAYRRIRSSLHFAASTAGARCLLVTSVGRGNERKAAVANVGVTLARTGKRVVIVSLDAKAPEIHDLLGVDNTLGLTDVLVGRVSPETSARDVPNVPNLSVVPIGPWWDELTQPDRLGDVTQRVEITSLLHRLPVAFDYVLVDCPPVLSSPEALDLVSLTEGIVIVVEGGRVARDELQQALAELRRAGGDRILAAVVVEGHRFARDELQQALAKLRRAAGDRTFAAIGVKGKLRRYRRQSAQGDGRSKSDGTGSAARSGTSGDGAGEEGLTPATPRR